MTSRDLFDTTGEARREDIAPGAVLLRSFCRERIDALLAAIDGVTAMAPFRHMTTPGGYRMSAAMTNCGNTGWVTDRKGYRYSAADPESGRPWPAMPPVFLTLATEAAMAGGHPGFLPDAALINRYEPGARLSLHQDRNERDFAAPIVSVSLGLPATFLFGGETRTDKQQRIRLQHGDVVVWGGPARLAFHGVAPLKEGEHPLLGRSRINLTLRKAL